MSQSVVRGGVCGACGVLVSELRRGRCFWCYQAFLRSRPIGLGAQCAACGNRRVDDLRHLDLGRSWCVLCHTCCARAERLKPRPTSAEGICQRLSRDRRWNARREQAAAVPSDERRRRDRRRSRGEAEAFARLVAALPDPDLPFDLAAPRDDGDASSDAMPKPHDDDVADALAAAKALAAAEPAEILDASELIIEIEISDEDLVEDPFEGPSTGIHDRVASA